jgi:nitrogen-specific signal transduction histidine kinase
MQAREVQMEADQGDMYDDMLDAHSLFEMSGKRLGHVLHIEARVREPTGLHDIIRQERERVKTPADLTIRGKRYRRNGVCNHDAETMEWARGLILLQEQRMKMEMDKAAKYAKFEVITDTLFAS